MKPVIEEPEYAVCFYCGETGADAMVGSGAVPGVPAHMDCWWNKDGDDS